MAAPIAPPGKRPVAIIDRNLLGELVPEIRRRVHEIGPTEVASRCFQSLDMLILINAIDLKPSTVHFYSAVAKAVGFSIEDYSAWDLFNV